jgi:hypothetical protein
MGKKRRIFTSQEKKMKKLIVILILVVLFIAGTMTLSAGKEDTVNRKYVERTYFLKNVSAEFAMSALRVYIEDHSARGNILSVRIREDKIKKFEELLNKIDRKRERIIFRIFTLIGSHNGTGEKIKNKALKAVLNELSEILSINSFKLDGVGSLSVMEGSNRISTLSLASRSGLDLKLMLKTITLRKDKSEERSVKFNFDLIGYISSSTSIRENGYLVAGVSKIGKNGDSLILIINADIE